MKASKEIVLQQEQFFYKIETKIQNDKTNIFNIYIYTFNGIQCKMPII